MSAAIFNRADFEHPSDGWYQIEKKGEHPNARAGVIQVIDDRACASIVNRFNADAEAGRLSHGQEMLIDHEHFKHDSERETRAYGWLTRLRNDADGIKAKMRWTATGKAAVDGGDYRFFSTEYDPKDLVVLNSDKPARVRPMRLDGLTLTNQPNNKGGRPITNRAEGRSNRAENNSDADQGKAAWEAAQSISRMALAEQRKSGSSLIANFRLVENREPELLSIATGKALRADLYAASRIARHMEEAGGSTPSQKLATVCNRFPRLARMVNREPSFDALADLEPTAHLEYMAAARAGKEKEKLCGDKGCDPETGKRFIRPYDSGVRLNYIGQINELIRTHPTLGWEGRWLEMRRSSPALFWDFVLTFDPNRLADSDV